MLSDKLHPTSKRNACPICGDVSGKCRTKNNEENFTLCANTATARKGDKQGAYKCINDHVKGHAPHAWVIDKNDYVTWDDDQKTRFKLDQQLKRIEAEKERQARIAAELPIDERDKFNRLILEQLTLTDADRQHLLNRGFTLEQIEECQFRSVNPSQPVKLHGCPINFPGLKNPGFGTDIRRIIITQSGILCPIMQDGKVIAFKVRYTEAKDGQRYSSVSSSGASFHVMGEQPIAVLHPPKVDFNQGIWVTEGSEIKPVFLNQQYNVAVLGGGRYWHNSPNHAAKVLPQLRELYGNQITLCPDAGDVINPQIAPKWVDEAEFFVSQGFDVRVAWWGQVTKDADDIDELKDLSGVSYISIDDSKSIINEHKKTEKEEMEERDWDNWVKSRKFTPDISINHSKFSFPANLPKSNAVWAAKSGLGTGKTEAFLKDIAERKDQLRLLGYRNNLLFQTIARGQEYQLKIYHLNDDNEYIDISHVHTACCINSGHKKIDSYLSNVLVIDEVEGVISHVIDGGTFSDFEQSRAMKTLETAVIDSSLVILLDGNLTDRTVDFIAKIDPNKKVVKIKNTHKIPPHQIIFCEGIMADANGEVTVKHNKRTHMIEMLSSEGVVPFIATDSKKFAHELGAYLIKECGKCGIIISQDTVHEPWAKEFLKDPNNYIKFHKPQFVIITPSCESGISITEKYFTHKFSFFCGVLGTSGQHQIMFRLRDNTIPHFVHCPPSTQIRDHEIPRHFCPQSIANTLQDRINQSALLALDNMDDECQGEQKQTAADIITRAIKGLENNRWFNLSSKMWAISNYEKSNLSECLIHTLEEAGHDVSIQQVELNDDIQNKLDEIKEDLLDAEVEAYVAARMMELEVAEKLAKKDSNDLDTRRRIKKTILFNKRLPGFDAHEAYLADPKKFWEEHLKNRDFISSHQNYAYLSQFWIRGLNHESNWFKAVQSKYFNLPKMAKMQHLQLSAMDELNLLSFVNFEAEYSKNTPEVLELFNRIKNDKTLQTKLNISKIPETETGKEIMELFKNLLGKIGIKLTKLKRSKKQGKREYIYKIDKEAYNDSLRLAIVSTVMSKEEEQCKELINETIDWKQTYSIEQLSEILADSLRAAKTYDDVIAAEQYLNSLKYEDNGKLMTEQKQHNIGIDIAMHKGYDLLSPQECQKVIDLTSEHRLKSIDTQISEDKHITVEHLQKLNPVTLWHLRLTKALTFSKDTAKVIYTQFSQTMMNNRAFMNQVWATLSSDNRHQYSAMFG